MPAEPPAAPWLLLRVRPWHERIAQDNLARLGVPSYVPRFFCRRNQRRAVLFPSYAFAKPPYGVSLRGCKGVRHIVMCGESPAIVPAGLVESFQAGEVDGLIVLEPPPPPLKPGDRVRIVNGSLAQFHGRIESLDGHGRCRLLLDVLFGGAVRCHTDVSVLEPVAA